jgi:3',5'-cyclic AMP phosphodiesterase CpdA
MQFMYRLAHLTDPHLPPLPRPRLAELAGKRLLGFVNWRLFRHGAHRGDVLQQIVEDLKASAPDHIAFTGDLVNIALAAEFAPARAFLDRLGPPDRVSFVPGNHDIYVRATAGHAATAWAEYMAGDAGSAGFPYLRRRGPLALIGLNSGVPTRPLMASGALGAPQRERLAAMLRENKGMFRVVLIHHPPLGHRPRHKRLTDAAPFLDVLRAEGAELVLHGHDHVHRLDWVESGDGRIPVVGLPSCSAAPGAKHDDPAAYNLYCVDGEPGRWRCEMMSRGIDAGGGVAELARRVLRA